MGKSKHYYGLTPRALNSLEWGFESAACTIRRRKDGSRSKKLQFFIKFLEERWHHSRLVLDNDSHNAFDESPIADLLPRQSHGAVLTTTRNFDTGFGNCLQVPKYMTEKDKQSMTRELTTAINKKALDRGPIKNALAVGFDMNRHVFSLYHREPSDGQTMLNHAIERGFEEAVRLFLDHGVDLEFDRGKASPLSEAAERGYLSIFSMILDHEERKKKYLPRKDYTAAMVRAISGGHIEICNLLKERRGNDFELEHWSVTKAWNHAAKNGNLKTIELLHSFGIIPNSDYDKADAVAYAMKDNRVSVVKYLVTKFALFDQRDPCGWHPLYTAAKMDNSKFKTEGNPRDEMISFLLSAGAAINAVDRDHDETALHIAAYRGLESTTSLLLSKGADPLLKEQQGNTPLMLALRENESKVCSLLANVDIQDDTQRREYFEEAFFKAAVQGSRDLTFAVSKHVDINMVDNISGDTALFMAIKRGYDQLSRFLIKKGAKLDVRDKNQSLPITIASKKGLDLVIRDMARVKASPGIEVKDSNGETPLMIATRENHEEVVKVLLKAGADRQEENQFGETALDIAEGKKLKRMIEILEDRDPKALPNPANPSQDAEPAYGFPIRSRYPPQMHAQYPPSMYQPQSSSRYGAFTRGR